MTESDLFALMFTTLREGLTLRGIVGVTVAQAFQPTQQGVPTGPLISAYSLGPVPMGSPKRLDDRYDPEEGVMVHSEKQKYTETFQFQVTAERPTWSPHDLAQKALSILQSDFAIQRFRLQEVGILRVGTIRNPNYSTDKNQHEFAPSFDLPVTYDRIDEWTVPVAQSVDLNIYRV